MFQLLTLHLKLAIEMDSQEGTPTPPDQEVMKCVNVTKTLNLRVKSFNNIDDVKDKFSELEDIETNLQKVFFTEKHFENDQALDYERKDGSSVHMNLHLGVGMQIRIEVPWSTKLTPLDVHNWDTIGDVKTKFQDKEGTPANQLTLFCDGKQLDDDFQTLAGYDIIETDSILHAVLIGEDKIKISVRPQDRDPIQVVVKLCSTVVNLKRMIHWMGGGFPVYRQVLTLNGVLLVNSQRLADYKIQMGSVIDLDVRSRKSGKKIEVFVSTLYGEKYTIYVDSSYTVHNLKTAIKNVEGTPEKKQILVFAGRQLQDDRTLVDYHITKESIIHMVGF